MSKEIQHGHLQDPSLLHQSFNYIQPTDPVLDPGVTLAYKQTWLDTSEDRLKFRNSTNNGWVTI